MRTGGGGRGDFFGKESKCEFLCVCVVGGGGRGRVSDFF